jgi:hypothetical protein
MLAPDSRATTPDAVRDSRPPATATDHTGLRTDDAKAAAAALFLAFDAAFLAAPFLAAFFLGCSSSPPLGGSLHRARALSCRFGFFAGGGLLRGAFLAAAFGGGGRSGPTACAARCHRPGAARCAADRFSRGRVELDVAVVAAQSIALGHRRLAG